MNPTIKARIESIRRGEVPEGYKRTKIGIVPNEWNVESLKSHLIEYRHLSNDIDKFDIYSSSRNGLMLQSAYYSQKTATQTNLGYKTVPNGYVTYRHMSDDDIFHFNINRQNKTILVSAEYPVFDTDDQTNTYFLITYLNSMARFRYFCRGQKMGGTRTRLYFNVLGDFKLAFPSISEQEKIAEILAGQDRVIALKEKLLAEKQKQKKYLMQQLLTGKKRLPGFSGEWNILLLGDICTIQTGKLDANAAQENGKFPFFTCAKEVLSINTFSFDGEAILLAGNGDVGTTILYNGKFDAYQRTYVLMNFLISAYLTKQYIDFQIMKIISKEKQGGAMPYIRLSSLEKLPLFVPNDFTEQTAIAEILSAADKEIELLQKDIEQEKLKKKSLMQLLLTGIVRVDELVS